MISSLSNAASLSSVRRCTSSRATGRPRFASAAHSARTARHSPITVETSTRAALATRIISTRTTSRSRSCSAALFASIAAAMKE